MRPFFLGVAAAGSLLVSGCSVSGDVVRGRAQYRIESVFTDLRDASCRRDTDPMDPNDTPHFVCPGVEGYSLIVRRVGSGRRSIDLVSATPDTFPLRLDDVVSRHMFSLGDSAEWRVMATDTTRHPIALIVRVDAHESSDDPARVTHTYWAITRITPDVVCITERIPDGERPAAEVRAAADSARNRGCAAPQPRLGTFVR